MKERIEIDIVERKWTVYKVKSVKRAKRIRQRYRATYKYTTYIEPPKHGKYYKVYVRPKD